MTRWSLSVVGAALLAACGSAAPPVAVDGAPDDTWKRVGTWSGRGDGQTTTFLTEHHEWRLVWEARPLGEAASAITVRVHSADSGRILDVPLDGARPGSGSVEVFEEPRVFYLSIEARGLEWSLVAEERVPGGP